MSAEPINADDDVKRCRECGWALREDEMHQDICFKCFCEGDK